MKSKDQPTDIKLSIVSDSEKANQEKIKFLKAFSLCTKRVFSWLSKNFPRTRSLCTERVFCWLLASLIDICFSKWGDSLPIPNWKHPLAERCAFAKILLQLFSCLCQPCCCWIYYQPFQNHSKYSVHTWTGPSRI